jgi:hypothetical protein
MNETIKRLTMTLLIVYLGVLLLDVAVSVAGGNEIIEALETAVRWPIFVLAVFAFQLSELWQ